MPKLDDTQLILLSAASRHPDGQFYPLPAALADGGGRATKAIAALVKRGFAKERETTDAATVHRTDGDVRYGMFITDAGSAAITGGGTIDASPSPAKIASTPKTHAVLALLKREGGASVSELIAATGWLPHTTRAALTGLRKKGHTIGKTKADGTTTYFIATEASRENA